MIFPPVILNKIRFQPRSLLQVDIRHFYFLGCININTNKKKYCNHINLAVKGENKN
jgi:hypothetical protein